MMRNLAFIIVITGLSSTMSGAPKSASSMLLSKVTSDSVVLSWEQTSSFHSVIIRYRATDSLTTGMCEEVYSPRFNRITVAGLSQLTDYEFFVAFVNKAGCSLASGPLYISTMPSDINGLNVDPTVTAVLIMLSVVVLLGAAYVLRQATARPRHLQQRQQQQQQQQQIEERERQQRLQRVNINDENYFLVNAQLFAEIERILAQLQTDITINTVPRATDDEIAALPVVRITQVEIDRGEKCTICQEEYQLDERGKSFPCDHFYHERCAEAWLTQNGTCPNCRRKVTAEPNLANAFARTRS